MQNLLYNSYYLLPRCSMTSETISLIEIMTTKLSTKPPLSEKPAKGSLNFISKISFLKIQYQHLSLSSLYYNETNRHILHTTDVTPVYLNNLDSLIHFYTAPQNYFLRDPAQNTEISIKIISFQNYTIFWLHNPPAY